MQNVEKIHISFIAYNDFANVLTNISYYLNQYSKKYASRVICNQEHKFNYKIKHDYDLDNLNEIKLTEVIDWMNHSKIIIIGDDVLDTNKLLVQYSKKKVDLSNKIIVPFYCGTRYRLNYEIFNKTHHGLYKHFIFNPDLYRLASTQKNNYILLQIGPQTIPDNICKIMKCKYNAEKIVIGHSPSRSSLKGTNIIIKAIDLLSQKYNNFEFRLIGGDKYVSNSEILKSKEEMHIYIDQYYPIVGGPGISSFESLTYGTIVLCTMNNINSQYYDFLESEPFPIIDIYNYKNINNDVSYLFEHLEKYCLMDRIDIMRECERSMEWTKKYLNPGKYLSYFENKILKNLI